MKEENSIRIERVVRTLVHSTSIIHVFPVNIMKVWSVQIGTKKEPIIYFTLQPLITTRLRSYRTKYWIDQSRGFQRRRMLVSLQNTLAENTYCRCSIRKSCQRGCSLNCYMTCNTTPNDQWKMVYIRDGRERSRFVSTRFYTIQKSTWRKETTTGREWSA